MRILVTGSAGQLGRELVETLANCSGCEVFGYDKLTLDVADYLEVEAAINEVMPEVIINTAAYTNVDGCEQDYHGAYSVNVTGAMNIARGAEKVGAKLIHVSTDFVFDGFKDAPYFEYDATNPISVYGKTKLAGEWVVRNECRKHFIIRTSWLYGKYGNNFVKTMIKLGKQNDEISVVTDQIGSPTYVSDFVEAIVKCMHSEHYGTYHFSNAGSCSWNEFAKEIFLQLNLKTIVKDVTSNEYVRRAKRPAYSVMDTTMIQEIFECEIKHWKTALGIFLSSTGKTL